MTAAHRNVTDDNPVRSFPVPPSTSTTMPERLKTAVPDVVGLTARQAYDQMLKSRVLPYIFYVYNPSVTTPGGLVDIQAPEGNEIVDVDAYVAVRVATNSLDLVDNSLPEPTGGPLLGLTARQRAQLPPATTQTEQ